MNWHGIYRKSNNVTSKYPPNTNTFIFQNPDNLILNIISKLFWLSFEFQPLRKIVGSHLKGWLSSKEEDHNTTRNKQKKIQPSIILQHLLKAGFKIMWQLVGIVVWLPLYLFICLRYTHSCFPTAQFSGWARIILNWDCNCVGMDHSSCKAKWHTSIGPRKESGIRGCLTLLVKWVLYGFGDSGRVCPYAPVYLSHNTGPLLHAASEAGMGQAWR